MDALSAALLALPITDPESFTRAVGEAIAAVLPLWRLSLNLTTMHPEIGVMSMFWTREGVHIRRNPHERRRQPFFLASPMAVLTDGAAEVRRRLTGPDARLDFPICQEVAAQGGTDYVALALAFSDGRRHGMSLTTRAPDGFTEAQLDVIRAAVPVLARSVELVQAYFATQTLLQVYLGPNAARRVLAGQFVRGSGTELRAALWICDLRGFTALSDRRPSSEVTATLDAYFERVIGPIHHHGGEVLKLIGDAVLAIFPVAADVDDACARALAAARAAVDALAAWNVGREDPLAMGVALHLGDVFYGNVGGPERLDFTVIGAAVNEVSRLEPLCKLGPTIVMSAAFRDHVDSADILDFGEHTLRGVAAPVRAYAVMPAPT